MAAKHLQNCDSTYGKNVMAGMELEVQKQSCEDPGLTEEEELVLRTFRLLVADLCQQFKGGHPGYVMSHRTSQVQPGLRLKSS